MNTVQLDIDTSGKGSFNIEQDGKKLAEMVISIANDNLTVFHTEVAEELKGQGVSTKLLSSMVEYAREHHLKVIPLCRFVNTQFKRNPDQYKDVLNSDWHESH